MNTKDEIEALQEKLATAVEALHGMRQTIREMPVDYGRGSDLRHWGLEIDQVLAAITSDAPAKAEPIDNGPADGAPTPQRLTGHRKPMPSAPDSASAGPASKPLVVGQRYRLGDLPVGARVGDSSYTYTIDSIRGHQATIWRQFTGYVVIAADHEMPLVSLPSAKADEGNTKACNPPALTREEVAEMISAAQSKLENCDPLSITTVQQIIGTYLRERCAFGIYDGYLVLTDGSLDKAFARYSIASILRAALVKDGE